MRGDVGNKRGDDRRLDSTRIAAESARQAQSVDSISCGNYQRSISGEGITRWVLLGNEETRWWASRTKILFAVYVSHYDIIW